jgi:prepilin-type processing-associated H-X9-DG protein
MSYGYRTELGLAGYTLGGLKRPADVNVLMDAAGYWHTRHARPPRPEAVDTQDLSKWSLNILFADGHVKNTPMADYLASWDVDPPEEQGPQQEPDRPRLR